MRHQVISILAGSLLLAGASAIADPILITGVESDTVQDPPRFPGQGVAGEWVRFGVPFNGLSIDTIPANADVGNNSIFTSGNWDAGSWGYGIRYVLPAPLDLTAGPRISFRALQTNSGPHRVQFTLAEGDGDVWVGVPFELTGAYETYIDDMSTVGLADGGGDSTLNLANIVEVGFTFLRNGATGVTDFRIDEIYYNVPEGGPVDPPVLPIVTSIEAPDFTTGGFPPLPLAIGNEGEWTRFGAAYNGIFLVNNPAQASDGDQFLQVSGNWEAGAIVGARHVPYGAPADWSPYDRLNVDLRVNVANAGSTVTVALFEDDGDVWVSAPLAPTTDWATYTVEYSALSLDGDSSGDGTLAADGIILWGVNFLNSTLVGQQDLLVDNAVHSSGAASVNDWQLLD